MQYTLNINRKRNLEKPDLNLAAFMDIVFLLLIFFMITATFSIQSSLDIDLPQASSAQEKQKYGNIIHIDKLDNIYLDKNLINLYNLQDKLEQIKKHENIDEIIISADQTVRHGLVDKCNGYRTVIWHKQNVRSS